MDDLRFLSHETSDLQVQVFPPVELVGGRVVGLAEGLRISQDAGIGLGEVLDEGELPRSAPIAEHDEGLAPPDPVDDAVVLPEDADVRRSRAVGQGRPDEGDGESLLRDHVLEPALHVRFVKAVRVDGIVVEAFRILPDGAGFVRPLVGRDARRYDDLGRPVPEEPDGILRFLPVEADHVDDSVETFGTHGLLEFVDSAPVSPDDPNVFGKTDALVAAVEKHDFLPFGKQPLGDRPADDAGSSEDQYSHVKTSRIDIPLL